MTKKDRIRDSILSFTADFYYEGEKETSFIPGKTYIPYAGRVYDQKELLSLIDASLEFWLTAGRYCKECEEKLASFLDVRFCILTNSGSSANLLAVSALTSPRLGDRALSPGDEVITTACGFPTTLNPIIQNNLIPVFVDIDIPTYNICVDHLESLITDKTKAIFIPHTLGNPADIDKIHEIVKKYRLWFIEDNCDALGSKYRGRYTGSFGHLSTGSFYPAHHITMGEGGAVFTSDPELKKIICSFRDWGRDCWCEPGCDNSCGHRFDQQFGDLPLGYDHKYVYSHIGYNLKITDLQAAIGVEQLKKLPDFISKRKENFLLLSRSLQKFDSYLQFPVCLPESEPSWFGFPILVRNDAPFTRNEIIRYLEGHKIATRMLFGGNLLKQPAYRDIQYRCPGSMINTDLVMNNLFWIGVFPGLTSEMLHYVISVFIKFFNEKVVNLHSQKDDR